MNWLRRLFGAGSSALSAAPPKAETPTVEEISRALPLLGQLIEQNSEFGLAVFDIETLPVPKARLEVLVSYAIGLTEEEQEARQLAAGLLALADYQAGVGAKPIPQIPSLPALRPNATDVEVQAAAATFLAHSTRSQYESFRPAIDADLKRLQNLADRALAIRAQRIAGHKRR